MTEAMKLQYQSNVYVAGRQMACVESYEAIIDRMREAIFKMTAEQDKGEMNWAAPLELTLQGPEGRPLRAAVALHAIAYVIEVPAEERIDVSEEGVA